MPYITEERRMIQEQAREFTLNEVLPIANKLDPEKGDIPMDLRDKMAELGYFGILIPEQYGGLGLGCFEYCLVTEELSRGWMSVASLIARGNLLIGSQMMSEEQRSRYLPRMAKGEFLGAFSMSEPNAGSDIANISCRARKDGTGYQISGNKYWCTFADGADFLIIIARTSDPPPGKRHMGLSMFLVEKKRGELPKGCSGAPIPKIGYFGWKTYELAFDSFRVEAADMIGEEGHAFYYATSGLETARAHTAARAIGLAQGALDDSIKYANDRKQFGRSISDFQAIRFKIAEMATQIEAARQLNYFVCEQIDTGQRCDKEASMVKLFASEMAERVCSEGIQIHGGAGYTTLHAVERHWRDARLTKIFEGTSEIQKRIISDRLLGRGRN
jgi:alkylation response protein AidB-like acyl-CoA dehydrogenase